MRKLSKFYLLAFILLTDFMMYAQPGDDNGGGDLEGDDPVAASINSKLMFLLVVGLVFAFISIKKYRKTA